MSYGRPPLLSRLRSNKPAADYELPIGVALTPDDFCPPLLVAKEKVNLLAGSQLRTVANLQAAA